MQLARRKDKNLCGAPIKREVAHAFYNAKSAKLFIKGDSEAAAQMTDKREPFEKESRRELEDHYRRTCGALGIQTMTSNPTAEEAALMKIVPKPNPALIGTLGLLNEYPVDEYVFPKLGFLGHILL
jgi:hypothetical protein